MDGSWFDRWTRRRFGRLAAGSAAALLGSAVPWATEAKRKRKKKKKQPSGCSRSCFNKVCGANDGCGGKCTVQAGCETDEACVDGACRPNVCNPACTGNHVCQPNGSCACPQGLHECEGPGYFGNCHECCVDPFPSVPDEECNTSPNGEFCRDDDGDLVFTCSCIAPAGCEEHRSCQVNCGGQCGECCDNAGCLFKYQDANRVCNANLGCECRPGTQPCQGSGLCRDQTSPETCGSICRDCGPNRDCAAGNCCIPLAGICGGQADSCCPGLNCVLNQQGTAFVCG
jgi:hypothetical protein